MVDLYRFNSALFNRMKFDIHSPVLSESVLSLNVCT
jgi:hypothetical protein